MIAAFSSAVPVSRLPEAIFGTSLATWICAKRPSPVKIRMPFGVSPNGYDFLPSAAVISATTKSQVPTICSFRLFCAAASPPNSPSASATTATNLMRSSRADHEHFKSIRSRFRTVIPFASIPLQHALCRGSAEREKIDSGRNCMKRWSALAGLLFVAVTALWSLQAVGQGGWTVLLDGKNIDNFNKIGDANWRIEDGAVVADKGNGFLDRKSTR